MTLTDDLRQVRREALAPPPSLSLAEWADRHARVPMAGNAQPGPWRPFAYQREWLQVHVRPGGQDESSCMKSRENWIHAVFDPLRQLLHRARSVAGARCSAARERRRRLQSEARYCRLCWIRRRLFEICGDLRSRSSEQRVAKRVFKNGASIAFVGANSPNSFRRISARVVLFDECDAYPAEVGQEGDAIALGVKRSETFHDRRIVLGSTPTIKYESRIERAFLGSDMRRYPRALSALRS